MFIIFLLLFTFTLNENIKFSKLIKKNNGQTKNLNVNVNRNENNYKIDQRKLEPNNMLFYYK